MRLVSVSLEGVRKIRAARVDFDPTGVLVEIHGPNETGKSSVIDGISQLIEPYAVNSPDRPFGDFVNYDAKRAVISGVISERGVNKYDVKRIFNKEGKTTSLSVRDLETGAPITQPPQKFLSSLFSTVARDPLLFLDKPADKQFEYFAKIKGIDKALAASDAAVKAAEERRKAARQALDLAEKMNARDGGAYETARQAANGIAEEPVDVQAVMVEKTEAESLASKIKTGRQKVEQIRNEIERANALIAETMTKVDQLEAQAAETEARIKAAGPLDAIEEKIRTCSSRIVNAQRINELSAKRTAAEQSKAEHTAKLKAFNDSEAAVKAEREKRQRTVADAPSPVPGLDIDAETKTITLDGQPLANASTARQAEVSIDLAVAENPPLKVLFLKQGSFIDGAHLAQIAKRLAAASEEWMLIFESVRREAGPDDDPNTFTIYGADLKRDGECDGE